MDKAADKSKEITEMLREWSGGKQEALDAILPLIYDELHRQAANFLRKERPGHTLQTTALIHETYVKLINQREVNWQNRAHFFGIAAQAMRRILVDYAKARHREKRGGAEENLPFEETLIVVSGERSIDLVNLDEALMRLAKLDERQAKIVELRYFGGLSIEETADALNISSATVKPIGARQERGSINKSPNESGTMAKSKRLIRCSRRTLAR